ncbi:hypothetical protein A2801_01500 [Candidatus Woesebacteria bacterium RIFCSPHIGHO2_01_FULL_41_10]|uniref:Methyltransferase type 11 domain-containing protein n=1 Tax=Candidatus Woesebacteria bacterium RIFCSPHIGHO2_01_FULL_41_10 TaxID=1802500 RepID=A0A1F7YQA6_9BACT|nr:MAG: hypothetical protein A2801_01500 [Candidatus Woesebacteria bacterium RIFCSPHIGHO2_01_FULL_41_10]
MSDQEQQANFENNVSSDIPKDTQWYFLPIDQRNSIVHQLREQPDRLVELSREIGLNTGTTTGFGRSYDILEASLPFVRASKEGNELKVLDIGPGMGMPSIVEMCHHIETPITDKRVDRQFSSEPFEIVAALHASGFEQAQLTAFDIDPLVLAIIDTQDTLAIERYDSNMENYYRRFIENVDPNAEPILNTEIHTINEKNTKYPEEHYKEAHLVKFPQKIKDAVVTKQADISEQPSDQNKYDLVYYMAVSIYLEDKENALTNVVESIRPGGILITSEVDEASKYGLEELTRIPWKKAKVCYRKAERNSVSASNTNS